ncbi:MAG: NusG domain II-containing protein, partial [Acholeplasmatales bacterium]|nr:NusG domain II-containing protein [Acholeplasmatales bacterium]
MGKIRNDIILIIVLAALIVSSFIWWFLSSADESNRLYVNIYYDEKLLYSTPLDENNEYVVKGKIGDVHIVIEDGYVSVV